MHDYSQVILEHNYGQKEGMAVQHSVLDSTWASKSVLDDIVQMRLELESSLRAGELVRSRAQQAERIAVQETEARAMISSRRRSLLQNKSDP